MVVIDIHSSTNISTRVDRGNYSYGYNSQRRGVISMASSSSTIRAEQQHERRQRLSGESFIRPNLRELSPYQPILPFEVLSEHLGRKPEDIIKLDANENPYGPPPEVLEALGSLKFPYIYPDPESLRLREALAADSGIESDYIVVGCGTDELIDLIMRCTLEPGDKILDCPPTFTMYAFDAAVNGAHVVEGESFINSKFSSEEGRLLLGCGTYCLCCDKRETKMHILNLTK